MLALSKRSLFLVLVLFFLGSSSSFAAKAPDFSLNSDSGTINLKQYRGKIVYLDFWASWCVPCRKSFPWMNEMQEKYQSKGLVVLGINLDENKLAATEFLKQVPANFTIAYDPEGETPGQYHVQVMPTSYLIDRDGNVVYAHKGFKKSQIDKVEKKIVDLLRK